MDTITELKQKILSFSQEIEPSAISPVREAEILDGLLDHVEGVEDGVESNAESIRSLEGTVGGHTTALDGLSGDIAAVRESVDALPGIADAGAPDLDIADENGNVVARFAGGHIKTKNFDSEHIDLNQDVVTGLGSESSDLDITDENGNIIVRFKGGGIRTKNFDSEETVPTYAYPNLVGSPHIYVPEVDTTGLALFASLNAIYDAYDALAVSYPAWFRRETDIGIDESGTYPLRHYTLRYQHPLITNDRAGTNANQWDDSAYPMRRIIVQSGIHPAERYSILGCYLGIKAILESEEEWAMFIKQNLVIDLLPCSNPWGAANEWVSTNVNGLNLNRTFFSDVQAENQSVINLIQELKPKGLVGIIDCHNTTNGDGYLVSKPSYKRWNYYAVVAQQLQASLYNMTNEIFGTARNNHFHLWDATGSSGQLHQYADSQGLLGCTFEIKSSAGLKGSIGTSAFMVNLVQAFVTYQGF